MDIKVSELNQRIENYLLKTNWHLVQCQDSHLWFFAKKRYGEELPTNSGHSKSKNARRPFVYDLKNEKFQKFENIVTKALEVFQNQYKIVNPKSVINDDGDTNFIGAPIQVIDDIIVRTTSFNDNPYFMIQPTIREKAINKVGQKIGVSSSFITLSTQRVNGDLQSYITDIDNWLNFLSKVGLDLFDLFLYPNMCWEAGEKMRGVSLNAYCGQLQLGDFVFINQVKNKPDMFIHDINFGLERIIWCINKKEEYFDCFTPLPYTNKFSDQQIDLLRTASLIVLCGGKSGSKNIKQKNNQKEYNGVPRIIRNIIRRFVRDARTFEVVHLLDYYYAFWSQFYKSDLSLERFKSEMLREIYFAYNGMLCKSLGINLNPNDTIVFESPNLFINNYLTNTNRKIPCSRIKQLIEKP